MALDLDKRARSFHLGTPGLEFATKFSKFGLVSSKLLARMSALLVEGTDAKIRSVKCSARLLEGANVLFAYRLDQSSQLGIFLLEYTLLGGEAGSMLAYFAAQSRMRFLRLCVVTQYADVIFL